MEEKEFIKVCFESDSMAQAAATLGMHFNTFKRKAVKLGCYNTNQSGKGITKQHNGNKIPLAKILDGGHPQYQTNKLKKRLIKEGLKTNQCEECKITEWNGKAIVMELDHIDGDRTNHSLENLKILCPNCHSQTETFRGKNVKR